METLLMAVLSATLSGVRGLKAHEVAFTNLPPLCAAAYSEDLRKLRGGVTVTEVIRWDINRDGSDELFVWDGHSGSGGEGWHIFTKETSEWKKSGEIFGSPMKVERDNIQGLLVSSPCGWSQCDFDYYELKNGVLHKILTLEITYARPDPQTSVLREKPLTIKFNLHNP